MKNSETATDVPRIEVQAGETLDFVADCFETVSSDSFAWGVRIQSLAPAPLVWDSAADFHGPLGASLVAQIAYAWQIVYGRAITADELELAGQFLTAQLATLRAAGDKPEHELAALTNLCQQLISSNEFLYVD